MFVGDEVLLEVSFAVACERVTQLTESGALITTSEDSYSREAGTLARVGAIGLSKLVRVQVRELARTEKSAGIALRWEAAGPGGGLFPVLDADVRLTPDRRARHAAVDGRLVPAAVRQAGAGP